MDTTPVMRRSRSKLSRRDRGLCSPSPMAVCAAAADRRASSDVTGHSTPLRAPPADSACWDSPVSPFSPPLLSQTCEVYWEDETQRRTAEELKRAVNRPGDRVPPLPAPLAASPAPLLPAGRRRTSRATRQQQQQLMALLERAETLCCQPSTPVAPATAEAEAVRAVETESETEQPVADVTKESNTSALPEIESDPELDRSMLRCTQLAEQAVSAAPATPANTSLRRVRSFNAFVMEAMPDDEDDIFSQIPDEALDGADREPKLAAAGESSSGVSSGSSGPPTRSGGGGRGLPRTVSAPDHRPPGETGRGWTAQPGRLAASQTAKRPGATAGTLQMISEYSTRSRGETNTVARPAMSNNSVMRPSVAPKSSAASRQSLASNNSAAMMKTSTAPNSAVLNPSAAPTTAGPVFRPQTNTTRHSAPIATSVAASIQRLPGAHPPAALRAGAAGAGKAGAGAVDPAKQKAEMNRRRAEALRRLRQNQRARSIAVSSQTR